jgi:hypothetical protein
MFSNRKTVLVGSALGFASAVMPWAKMGIISVSGIDGSDGFIVIAIFAVALVMSLAGNRATPLSGGARIGAILAGLAGSAVGIWKLIDLDSASTGRGRFHLEPGIGLYLMVVAGGVVVLGALLKSKAANPSTTS